MAYMSQEKKKSLMPGIKAALKKFGMKGTVSVHNHSTLIVRLKSGPIDFSKYVNTEDSPNAFRENIDFNPYWFHKHYTGVAKDFLQMLFDAMKVGNHDRSDPMTDYFDVGWYVTVKAGDWNKPYVVTKG